MGTKISNHSRGEWTARIAEDESGDEWEVVAPYPGLEGEVLYVALCPSMGDTCGSPEDNARLIAAAPDMLDALHKAREWLEGWGSAEHQLSVVNSAIAKATQP